MEQKFDWECHQMMMAKHKCLEKMEDLNKRDTDELSHTDFQTYKNCAKTLYYIMSVEKAKASMN